MIYVYAIAEAPADVGAAGILGAPVRTVVSGPLAAVVSTIEEPPAAEPPALLSHEAVVEAVMAAHTVLPVQFGMTLPSEDDLAALLDRRREGFRERLEEVRGCVELSVRVRWDPAEPDSAVSGRRYLEDRQHEHRRADAFHAPLAGLARAATTRSEPGLLTAAYLVPAEEVGPFTGRVAAIRDQHPALDCSCTGPWPPYSFVGAR